jgi:hypothetical protein
VAVLVLPMLLSNKQMPTKTVVLISVNSVISSVSYFFVVVCVCIDNNYDDLKDKISVLVLVLVSV